MAVKPALAGRTGRSMTTDHARALVLANGAAVARSMGTRAAEEKTKAASRSAAARGGSDSESDEVAVLTMDALYWEALRVLLAGHRGKKEGGTARLRQLESLTTGGVSIRYSSVVGGGRGVYVNRRFRAGEWVCLYGGILTFEDELRKRPHDQQQHARRTGNPQLALDGYPLASLFPSSARDEAKEKRKAAKDRRHLLPADDAGALSHSCIPRVPGLYPSPPPSQETVISLIARA